MRRRDWVIWTAVLVTGIAGLGLAYTLVRDDSPWRALGPAGGALFGSGGGQLIRGWWRVRHAVPPIARRTAGSRSGYEVDSDGGVGGCRWTER